MPVADDVRQAHRDGPRRWSSYLPVSPGRRLVAGAVLVALLFTLIQALNYRQVDPSPDTYLYARQTLRIIGYTPSHATSAATAMYCQDSAASSVRRVRLEAGMAPTSRTYHHDYTKCLAQYRHGRSPNPSSSRYTAIFTSRPGYPLLSAPLVAVLGLRLGMWLAVMCCAVLGGVVVLVMLRMARCSVLAALAGQALYLASPAGYWSSRMLSDGPSLTTTLVTLLGAWLMVRRRLRLGVSLLAVGLVTGFAMRYSTELMVVVALGLAAVGCLIWEPTSRHRGTVLLVAIPAVGLVVSAIAVSLLSWPGLSTSLQDTFTQHFTRPDVSNPVVRLIGLNLHFWKYFLVAEPTETLLACGLVVVSTLLFRRDRPFALLVIAAAATGVGTVVAHPLVQQSDRLMVPVWLIVALGLPRVLRWRRGGEGPSGRADLAPAEAGGSRAALVRN